MATPKQVLDAEAEADQGIEELENELKNQASEASGLDDLASEESPEADGDEESSDVEEEEESDDSSEEEQEDESGSDDEESDDEQGDEAWRQKYLTLQGMYNADVPRLRTQLLTLQSQLATVQAAPAPGAGSEKPKGPAYRRYLKDEEVETMGDETLDMQARLAQGVTESILEGRIAALQERIDTLETGRQQDESEAFWGLVESQIPEARDINENDPLWHKFLDTKDPLSGLSYREIGGQAINGGDASRLVMLFSEYLGSGGSSEVKKKKKSEDTGEGLDESSVPAKPRVTRGTSAPKRSKAGKPTIRESEIKSFYEEVARGRYKNREDERAKREKLIEDAAVEGRIVAG